MDNHRYTLAALRKAKDRPPFVESAHQYLNNIKMVSDFEVNAFRQDRIENEARIAAERANGPPDPENTVEGYFRQKEEEEERERRRKGLPSGSDSSDRIRGGKDSAESRHSTNERDSSEELRRQSANTKRHHAPHSSSKGGPSSSSREIEHDGERSPSLTGRKSPEEKGSEEIIQEKRRSPLGRESSSKRRQSPKSRKSSDEIEKVKLHKERKHSPKGRAYDEERFREHSPSSKQSFVNSTRKEKRFDDEMSSDDSGRSSPIHIDRVSSEEIRRAVEERLRRDSSNSPSGTKLTARSSREMEDEITRGANKKAKIEVGIRDLTLSSVKNLGSVDSYDSGKQHRVAKTDDDSEEVEAYDSDNEISDESKRYAEYRARKLITTGRKTPREMKGKPSRVADDAVLEELDIRGRSLSSGKENSKSDSFKSGNLYEFGRDHIEYADNEFSDETSTYSPSGWKATAKSPPRENDRKIAREADTMRDRSKSSDKEKQRFGSSKSGKLTEASKNAEAGIGARNK